MKLPKELLALSRRTKRRVRGAGRAVPAVVVRTTRPPIFVGGTGRSGTTITSGLLGHQPGYLRIRTEVKFISNHRGLCDLVEGRTNLAQFERRLLDRWFDRGERKGLKVILERADIEAALAQLRDEVAIDPYGAAAAFTHRLLDPLAVAADQQGWIENTPSAALEAQTLYRMFPDMKLVHLVRDGRDVACSLLRMTWGPNDVHSALDWWANRLERAFAACERLPPERLLVVQLEDLVVRDRERQYGNLLSFLDFVDAPQMREFFETRMPADAMHGGRWKRDVPPEMLPAFEAHYLEIEERLRRSGYPYHAEPAAAPARA